MSNQARYSALASICCSNVAASSLNNNSSNEASFVGGGLVDTFSQKRFNNPFLAPSGYSYEEEPIKLWLQFIQKDPITGTPLTESQLVVNGLLQRVATKPPIEPQDVKEFAWEIVTKLQSVQDIYLARYLKSINSSLKLFIEERDESDNLIFKQINDILAAYENNSKKPTLRMEIRTSKPVRSCLILYCFRY